MYYPPDWPANDASATGRNIHDVTMSPKHIDPSFSLKIRFLSKSASKSLVYGPRYTKESTSRTQARQCC